MALEATALSQALLSDQLTLSQYASALGVWHLAWGELEDDLAAVPTPLFATALRPEPRVHLLVQDWSAVAPGHRWEPLPTPGLADDWRGQWASLEPRSRGLALCYVMTGSAMGNRVVLAHLQKRLGVSAEYGASFFADAGQSSHRPMAGFWAEWKLHLNHELPDRAAWDSVAHAAVLVFERLTERFASWQT